MTGTVPCGGDGEAARTGGGRDWAITSYFRTYMERARRVMDLSGAGDGPDGAGGSGDAARRRREDAYWILEKTRGLEREHPWLRLAGIKAPPVLAFKDLPAPEERARVYGQILDKVLLLESRLDGLEKALGDGFPFEARPLPLAGAGGNGREPR
jgi:hypothetical protein